LFDLFTFNTTGRPCFTCGAVLGVLVVVALLVAAAKNLQAGTEKVNQASPGMTPQGYPMVHAFQPENLQAKGNLPLNLLALLLLDPTAFAALLWVKDD